MTTHTSDLAQKHFAIVRFARHRFATRPIINGPLAERGLLLARGAATDFAPESALDLVVDPVSLCPVGAGHTKAEALASAREAIAKPDFDDYIAEYRRLHDEEETLVASVIKGGEVPVRRGAPPVQKPPKRRRIIFEKSNGRCHYCSTQLTLNGKWHIEHRMPRALMGGNEPSNLVASCVPCNLKKRDMTDEEFIAKTRAAAMEAA